LVARDPFEAEDMRRESEAPRVSIAAPEIVAWRTFRIILNSLSGLEAVAGFVHRFETRFSRFELPWLPIAATPPETNLWQRLGAERLPPSLDSTLVTLVAKIGPGISIDTDFSIPWTDRGAIPTPGSKAGNGNGAGKSWIAIQEGSGNMDAEPRHLTAAAQPIPRPALARTACRQRPGVAASPRERFFAHLSINAQGIRHPTFR
jgi:hypothetical protein